MTLATKLLGGSGSGAFTAAARTFEAETDSGNTWPNDPKYLHHEGYTYLTWSKNATGAVQVAAWDHATRTLSTAITLGTFSPDIHNGAALCVRDSDHRLVVVYCGHNLSNIYRRISVNSLDTDPTLSGGFGAEAALDASLGGTLYTYPTLYQLVDEASQPLYLICRDQNFTGYIMVSVSTDGGNTFGARTLLFTPDTNEQAYYRVMSNGRDRIDILTTDTNREVGNPSQLLHLYWQGGAWRRTDGTAIAGATPYDATDVTVVKDASGGPCNPCGISYQPNGDPVAVFQLYNDPLELWFGRWTGAAWSIVQVEDDVDYHGNNIAAIDRLAFGERDSIWTSMTIDGSTVDEIVRYDTTDGGATWSAPRRLTFGSTVRHDLVESVFGGVPGMRVLSCRGTFTDNDTWDYDLWGLR